MEIIGVDQMVMGLPQKLLVVGYSLNGLYLNMMACWNKWNDYSRSMSSTDIHLSSQVAVAKNKSGGGPEPLGPPSSCFSTYDVIA